MKKTMKRRVSAALLCLFVACALCACSAPAAKSAASSTSESTGATATASASASSSQASSTPSAEAVEPHRVAPSTSGALHVEGTRLVDEQGRNVQLRGASTHGLAWFPAYVNSQLFGQLRQDWNANVVRLAMYTAESGGYCTDGDKAQLRQLVDDGVRFATENDLYAIIDWHILSDNNPLMHADEAEEFFRDVSAAYANRNNVLYEICNEPNGATTWADVKAYAERIIPVIRANDPDAVVIVGTPTWSQDVDAAAADPLDFDNVMYALHFYAATHKDDLRSKAAAAYDAGLPLFVTEFGICDASGNGAIDEEQADAWISFLDDRGISYAMWNLSNKAESSAAFKATCDKVSGFDDADLGQSGAWLKRTLVSGPRVDSPATSTDGSSASSGASSLTATTGGSAAAGASGASTSAVRASGDIEYRATLRTSWQSDGESFFLYDIVLVNNGDAKSSWQVEVPFNAEVKLSDSWNGVFEANGTTLRISNADYNGSIAAGGSVADIGFIVSGPANLELAL